MIGEELEKRDAWTNCGALGAFRQFLPTDQGHAVTSLYAEIARRQGWVRFDRVLDGDEYRSMLATIDSWASCDRVWEEVTSAFGSPSIVFGGSSSLYPKTLGYATREPFDPMVFFHLWNGSEPEAESCGRRRTNSRCSWRSAAVTRRCPSPSRSLRKDYGADPLTPRVDTHSGHLVSLAETLDL
ncbi:hypothetical protein ABH940_003445 [Streptacidiphilus sp. BW17]|uniref:hypothetical protein n=1 Tax=Streptacidiphilus sp. BW17 TaxID=3156274 RepID=UPI0035116484